MSQEGPYQDRDATLQRLGFSSNAAYMRSRIWRGIREAVIARAQGQCERCGRPCSSWHVWHRAFDRATLMGTVLGSLSALCDRCDRGARGASRPARNAFDRMAFANAFIIEPLEPLTPDECRAIDHDERVFKTMRARWKHARCVQRSKGRAGFNALAYRPADLTPRLVKKEQP